MSTFDQMIIDDRDLANQYFGENNLDDFDDDQYLFSKQPTNNRQQFNSKPLAEHSSPNTNDNDTGLFGRRVFLESPSLGNKDEEDIYRYFIHINRVILIEKRFCRYVPSRLSEHRSSIVGVPAPAPTGETLIDSLDFELDLLGATNARHAVPYQTKTQLQEYKPPAPLTQITHPVAQSPMTNMRR
jgi:hypothetical protein